MSTERGKAQTKKAHEAAMHYAAERAIDDPVKLAKAARIVRLALERGRLTRGDLLTQEEANAMMAAFAAAVDAAFTEELGKEEGR